MANPGLITPDHPDHKRWEAWHESTLARLERLAQELNRPNKG